MQQLLYYYADVPDVALKQKGKRAFGYGIFFKARKVHGHYHSTALQELALRSRSLYPLSALS